MSERPWRPCWVSPLPPLATGIGQYSADLLRATSGFWHLDILPEPGSGPVPSGFTQVSPAAPKPEHSILQVGNSQYHEHAFSIARRGDSILVLHDVVLHHARLAEYIRRGKGRDYVNLMEDIYGSEGRSAANDILRGARIDIERFPLSEDLIRAARTIVVHSNHARQRALELVPATDVHVVPMGVPLPAEIDKAACRAHFGVPEDTFLVSSITHVNPMKRIPVVLRAFRRLVERNPASQLIIAGSVAAGMDLDRQIQILGLSANVRTTGYIDDNEARLLARASDVCVNLRYPSTGETSASLLRLMGAGVPVIISRHGSAVEVPDDCALHLPVDRLEEETLAEYLAWLASDPEAVSEIGTAGRRFVGQYHSMGAAVDGYRSVMQSTWGIDLPGLPCAQVVESMPTVTRIQDRRNVPAEPLPSDKTLYSSLADALSRSGLGAHGGTIQAIAQSMASIGIEVAEGGEAMTNNEPVAIDPALLELLACPVCKQPVQLDGDGLKCTACGRTYAIENGIPIMLVESDNGE